jgi:hypothetical protein
MQKYTCPVCHKPAKLMGEYDHTLRIICPTTHITVIRKPTPQPPTAKVGRPRKTDA